MNKKVTEGNILVNTYSGLGDAIINGSIIGNLGKWHDYKIFYPENSMISYFKEEGYLGYDNVFLIDKKYRNLMNFGATETSILEKLGIKTIINLRRDETKYGKIYTNKKQKLNKKGIKIIDFSELGNEKIEMSHHFFELNKKLLYNNGLIDGTIRYNNWIKDFTKEDFKKKKINDTIGIYIGGSVNIKRPRGEFWIKMIKDIKEKGGFKIRLYTGISTGEKEEIIFIKNNIENLNVEIAKTGNISEIINDVTKLQFMISTDSYMLHLCEGLGINTFGIFTSTNPKIYGPLGEKSLYSLSPKYKTCPHINKVGNCSGWEKGCKKLICHEYLETEYDEKIIKRILKQMKKIYN